MFLGESATYRTYNTRSTRSNANESDLTINGEWFLKTVIRVIYYELIIAVISACQRQPSHILRYIHFAVFDRYVGRRKRNGRNNILSNNAFHSIIIMAVLGGVCNNNLQFEYRQKIGFFCIQPVLRGRVWPGWGHTCTYSVQ